MISAIMEKYCQGSNWQTSLCLQLCIYLSAASPYIKSQSQELKENIPEKIIVERTSRNPRDA